MIIFEIKKWRVFYKISKIFILFNVFMDLTARLGNYDTLASFLITNIVLLFGTLNTAYAPIYRICIDNEKSELSLYYYFLYLFKKQKTLAFNEFDYRYEYAPSFISLGGYKIDFYFNKFSKATMETHFGWKKAKLQEIIPFLEDIKPYKPRLLDDKKAKQKYNDYKNSLK